MGDEDVYLDAYDSVTRLLVELTEELRTKFEPEGNEIEYRNIDGHAENQVLENHDFLFMRGFSGNIGLHFCDYTFEVGISTFEDQNLFRHQKMLNHIIKRLSPNNQVIIYSNRDWKVKKGTLVITEPTTIMPFAKYNTRSIQYILVSVESTETKL